MERGDTGLGRDAYGLPRRRRPGEHRAYRRRGEGDEPTDADGVNGPQGAKDDYYGQLLRRPDEFPPRLRQPGRPRLRQPGRFPPPSASPGGFPASGGPVIGDASNGRPPIGDPSNGRPLIGDPSNGRPLIGDASNGRPPMGGQTNGGQGNGGPLGGAGTGGPMPGRQYWLPNGRRVPPGYDQPYRPQAAGPAEGTWNRPGPGQVRGRPAGQDSLGDGWVRPGWAPGQPPPQAPGVPPAGARGPYGAESDARERPASRPPYGIQGGGPVPQEAAGPVIRQRETAVPAERPRGAAHSIASIAPDGLEAFARDLRALRAKAELDYEAMAELSHYTMKTLASAAGGLRMPTLPVAVAYVRACGGNVTEWEERWQKLAAKASADSAKKRRPDDDEQPEPSDAPAVPEPPALKAPATEAAPEPGAVYVITSAKPRQPGW